MPETESQTPAAARPRWLRLRPLGLSVLLALLAAVPALAFQVADRLIGPLTPELGTLALVSLCALLTPVLLIVRLVRGARRWPLPGAGRKVLYYGGSLLLQLGLLLGLAVGILLINFKLFEPSYLGVKRWFPAHQRTVYLHSTGLFCGYTVHARSPGQLTLTRLYQFNVKCESKPRAPGLRWPQGADRPTVTDEKGRPVQSHTVRFPYWGPR